MPKPAKPVANKKQPAVLRDDVPPKVIKINLPKNYELIPGGYRIKERG